MIYRDAKILFLDIDGVLNSLEFRQSPRCREAPAFPEEIAAAKLVDPVAVEVLDEVVRRTGALVVLSSMWRYAPGMPALMQRMIDARGARMARIVDRTPTRDELDGEYAVYASPIGRDRACPRGYEICQWLRTHGVRDYAIVDDDDDMVSVHDERTREFAERFVLTDFQHGMRAEEGDRIIEILGSTP